MLISSWPIHYSVVYYLLSSRSLPNSLLLLFCQEVSRIATERVLESTIFPYAASAQQSEQEGNAKVTWVRRLLLSFNPPVSHTRGLYSS